MTRYEVRLYAHADELCARYVECGKKEIPRMLARFVLDYIKNALYPGAMTATVSAGRDMFLYIIKIDRRHRNSVSGSIPTQYCRCGKMMLPARIHIMYDNGGPFRMYICRKITGPAP